MNEPIEEREALWDKFLRRWPLDQLTTLTLEDYNQVGADDSFCRWLEKHLESLGSIWGGSSLKFGIYSRANTGKDPSGQNGVTANGRYAWYSRYGQSEEVAFARVRDLIVATAQAAHEGRLDAIEAIDLWPILKWKIAFLYQDRQQPTVLSIYLRKYLAAALTGPVPTSQAEMYRVLLAERGNQPLLAYADAVYERGQVALQHQQRLAVLGHFTGVRELETRLQAANATLAFCDLALALHEQGLDWWITEAGAIHAGRTEDFRVWQVAVALRVEVGTELTCVCVQGAGEEQWQVLEEALVDSLIETVARASAPWPKPARAAYWPDDYDNMADRLVITLTDGAIRNGYLSVPKLQRLFPDACFGESDQPALRLFTLRLPDGRTEQTQVLKQHKRIQARFNSLFAAEGLQAGDQAVLSKIGEFDYQLSFRRAGQQSDLVVPQAEDLRKETFMRDVPLNQILFGPPGTGKTFATVDAALEVLDPDYLQVHRDSREALKQRFDALVAQDRIRFVTFHQSFSYEDFVEGLRATSDEASGQLRYEVVDGVFKSLCEAAAAKVTKQAEAPADLGRRRIWKMSLGNTLGEDASIYQECLAGGYVLLGYGGAIDFSGCNSRQQVQERFAQAGVTPESPATDYGITSVTAFVSRMQEGDLIVVSDGNFKFRAIGEVSGDYQFKAHADFPGDYSQMRPVKWLRQYQPSLPHTELLNAQFSQMTLYELRAPTLDRDKLKKLLGTGATEGAFAAGQVFGRDYQVVRATADLLELRKPNGNLLPFAMNLLTALADGVRDGMITLQDIREKTAIDKLSGAGLEPYLVNGYNNILAPLVEYMLGSGQQAASAVTEREARVLIIDEINRGNISRIFGELITLIEPSKRTGADEALSVLLPYSKQAFSVPQNLYLIGTMNTADRSLAGLDIALRRRFVFREMPPRPELLEGVRVEGVDVGELLRVMNQRIEVLLDKDHCLGHAYFVPLMVEASLAHLARIFRNQVIPLLQEYFFEDWQRIGWVLNDHRKAAGDRFIQQKSGQAISLFGQDVGEGLADGVWELNEDAFERQEAYLGIIDASRLAVEPEVKRQASHGDLVLRELASGTIELLHNGKLKQPVLPVLREMASDVGVAIQNANGNDLNTRALGSKLITYLSNGGQ